MGFFNGYPMVRLHHPSDLSSCFPDDSQSESSDKKLVRSIISPFVDHNEIENPSIIISDLDPSVTDADFNSHFNPFDSIRSTASINLHSIPMF
jgi:hypothetical protein